LRNIKRTYTDSNFRDNVAALANIEKAISNVSCQNVVGIVLQGLSTGADCATPKFRTLDLGTYQQDYVDRMSFP